MSKIEVHASIVTKVIVDSIDVLNQINIINPNDWIIKKDGKYIQMTEQSAGQRCFDVKVCEVSKEVYDAYKAKLILIKYLRKLKY